MLNRKRDKKRPGVNGGTASYFVVSVLSETDLRDEKAKIVFSSGPQRGLSYVFVVVVSLNSTPWTTLTLGSEGTDVMYTHQPAEGVILLISFANRSS